MISRRGTNRLFWPEPHVRPEEPWLPRWRTRNGNRGETLV